MEVPTSLVLPMLVRPNKFFKFAVGEQIILQMEQAGESGTILMGLSFHLLPVILDSTEQEITWLSD